MRTLIALEHVQFSGVESSPRPRVRGEALHTLPLTASWHNAEPAPAECLEPDLEWILFRCGINPRAYRPKVLQRRVPACLRKLRVPDLRSARELLESHPGRAQEVLSSFLLGVSGWFRDPDVFESLQTLAIPEMLADRSGLRVLSAGCSDGQELYSVAMLLDECGALDFSQLLGVDCRLQATRNASLGEYPAACLDEIPCDRQLYFEMVADKIKVIPRLRRAIYWRDLNLFDLEPSMKWEMVLFRNVAIYLGARESEKLFQLLADALVPGGVLVTGSAERPPDALRLRKLGPCIYQKPEGRE